MHSHPEAADTLIVGAQLYDGTGAPPVERDVAIRDGRIAAIGNLSNWLAEEVVEANGRALAPGFIDVHTHDDTQRVAGVAEGRSARSDESAWRARCVPVPDFRCVRRSGKRRAPGSECRRADWARGRCSSTDIRRLWPMMACRGR